MKLFGTATLALGIALLATALVPRAGAGEWDKKTVVTFSNPVEIPGVHMKGWGVLPAGTYVMKLVDTPGDRHVVQILNRDETIVYATILAIPNLRLTPTSKTVITFNEGIKDRPEALRAWFYPGAVSGEEFVYPKAKAMELASVSKTPVLAMKTADLEVEVEKPEAPAVVASVQAAPIIAVKPTGEEVEVAQVIAPAPAAAVVAAAPVAVAPASLPATGSSMPLIGLFGVLALAGGLSLRFVSKGMIAKV